MAKKTYFVIGGNSACYWPDSNYHFTKNKFGTKKEAREFAKKSKSEVATVYMTPDDGITFKLIEQRRKKK